MIFAGLARGGVGLGKLLVMDGGSLSSRVRRLPRLVSSD